MDSEKNNPRKSQASDIFKQVLKMGGVAHFWTYGNPWLFHYPTMIYMSGGFSMCSSKNYAETMGCIPSGNQTW